MKIITRTILILLLIIGQIKLGLANHVAGGELTYKWISDSTYQVTLKVYRDCGGAPTRDTIVMCLKNTCTNNTQVRDLIKLKTLPNGSPNGQIVNIGCQGYPTTCTNPSSAIPGYEEWIYTTTIKLWGKCNNWKMTTVLIGRNVSNNLTPLLANDPFYIEANINNQYAQGNSSPTFSVKPVPYICLNKPYTYNNGVVDLDGDSLDFEIIKPLTSYYGCNNLVRLLPFKGSSPPLSLTSNPLQTKNTFILDKKTGQMSFTPYLLGPATIALKVNEYRNGVLIGSVIRDLQIQVLQCNSTQPQINLLPKTFVGDTIINNRIEGCAGVPMLFCFDIKSVDTSANLIPYDNHFISMPSSSISYNRLKSDSIRGCFSWIPPINTSGLKILSITVKDSNCKPPGILYSQTLTIPIYIRPYINKLIDTTICLKDSIILNAPLGSSALWSVKPGGSPIASLSCSSCNTTFAKPTISTTYYLEMNFSPFCGLNMDTVTVNVKSLPKTPVINSISQICEHDTITINTTRIQSQTYEWNGPNGLYDTSDTILIYNASSIHTGVYSIKTNDGICESDIASIYIKVNPIPNKPIISSNSPLCDGDTLKLTSNTNINTKINWSGPNGLLIIKPNIIIANVSKSQEGRYTANAEQDGCISDTSHIDVTVSEKVYAKINTSKDKICQYDTIVISIAANNGINVSYKWNWISDSSVKEGPHIIKWLNNQTIGTVSLEVTNNGCSAIDKKDIIVLPAPKDAFSYKTDACINTPIFLEAFRDYDVDYHWNFDEGLIRDTIGFNYYTVYWQSTGIKNVSLYTIGKNGCKSLGTIHRVNIHDKPIAKIEDMMNYEICSGDSIFLSAYQDDSYSYSWLPKPYFLTNSSSSVYAKILNTSPIHLKVINKWGCINKDSISFSTKPCCTITLPDIFTPNSDGRNDKFRILTNGNHDIQNFKILNRWGQVVFNTINEDKGWDGKFKETNQDIGTYYYYIKYKCANGHYYEKKGTVILIR